MPSHPPNPRPAVGAQWSRSLPRLHPRVPQPSLLSSLSSPITHTLAISHPDNLILLSSSISCRPSYFSPAESFLSACAVFPTLQCRLDPSFLSTLSADYLLNYRYIIIRYCETAQQATHDQTLHQHAPPSATPLKGEPCAEMISPASISISISTDLDLCLFSRASINYTIIHT